MAKKVVGRGADQFVVRLPTGMRQQIAKMAGANARSMNTEIILALEKHIEDGDPITELREKVDKLEEMVFEPSGGPLTGLGRNKSLNNLFGFWWWWNLRWG